MKLGFLARIYFISASCRRGWLKPHISAHKLQSCVLGLDSWRISIKDRECETNTSDLNSYTLSNVLQGVASQGRTKPQKVNTEQTCYIRASVIFAFGGSNAVAPRGHAKKQEGRQHTQEETKRCRKIGKSDTRQCWLRAEGLKRGISRDHHKGSQSAEYD